MLTVGKAETATKNNLKVGNFKTYKMKKIFFLLSLLLNLFSYGQINSDVDPDFNFTSAQGNGEIRKIIVQPDNKILVCGFILHYPSNKQNLFRLNNDGTIDNTFTSPSIVGTSQIQTMVLQNDGKIIIAQNQVVLGGTVKRLYRINTDGTLDNTFDVGIGFDDTPNVIKIQSDGKILVGGDFITLNGITKNRIVRLNSNGSIDTSFDAGLGFNSSVNSIEIQSDGKILVGGNFNTFNGFSKTGLVRLNSNGSIDNYFYIGVGPSGTVDCIYIQNDGKIIIGGTFGMFNNITSPNLVRLSSSGNLDNTFNIGTGFTQTNSSTNGSPKVKAIIISGNSIFIGGHFDKFNNILRKNFVSINLDGTIDTSFTIGTGFIDNNIGTYIVPVKCFALQSNSKLLIGGSFQTYNSLAKPYITRLFGNSLSSEDFFQSKLSIYPNPTSDMITIKSMIEIKNDEYNIYDLLGKKIDTKINNNQINVSELMKGIYLLKIQIDNNILETKFIKQ